jgi:signal transduction histidine kinase
MQLSMSGSTNVRWGNAARLRPGQLQNRRTAIAAAKLPRETSSGRWSFTIPGQLSLGAPGGGAGRIKAKILLVEAGKAEASAPFDLMKLGQMLEQENYFVYKVDSTIDAFEESAVHRPALIIINVNAMDQLGASFDLVREVKSRWPLTKIFILTARPVKHGDWITDCPVDLFVEKQIAPQRLMVHIDYAIELREREVENRRLEIIAQERMRLADLGTGAASVANKMNNLVQGMLLRLSALRIAFSRLKQVPPQDGAQAEEIEREFLHHLDDAESLLSDMGRFAGNLLELARDSSKPELFQPNDVLRTAIMLTHKQMLQGEIALMEDYESALPDIFGDRRKFLHAAYNLLMNAIEAISFRGTISIVSKTQEGKMAIEISDTGPGIPQEVLGNIFDPFFTTKGQTGLGLYVVKEIIESMGGMIEVKSGRNKGTSFVLVLPCACKKGDD